MQMFLSARYLNPTSAISWNDTTLLLRRIIKLVTGGPVSPFWSIKLEITTYQALYQVFRPDHWISIVFINFTVLNWVISPWKKNRAHWKTLKIRHMTRKMFARSRSLTWNMLCDPMWQRFGVLLAHCRSFNRISFNGAPETEIFRWFSHQFLEYLRWFVDGTGNLPLCISNFADNRKCIRSTTRVRFIHPVADKILRLFTFHLLITGVNSENKGMGKQNVMTW